MNKREIIRPGWTIVGIVFMPVLWWILTDIVRVSPRYLPSISSVALAWRDLNPSLGRHCFATGMRFFIGFTVGTSIGVGLALGTARFPLLDSLLMPTVRSMRAVPAAAIVPFFLLWFGFSEVGRYLIAIVAVSFNVCIAARQILTAIPSSHNAFFKSFQLEPSKITLRYCLPRIVEDVLPTLRYSLALSLGAITVAELLGAQVGLGYLLQTARSTFSLHLLFLAMIVLGLLSVLADSGLCFLWKHILYWRPKQ